MMMGKMEALMALIKDMNKMIAKGGGDEEMLEGDIAGSVEGGMQPVQKKAEEKEMMADGMAGEPEEAKAIADMGDDELKEAVKAAFAKRKPDGVAVKKVSFKMMEPNKVAKMKKVKK